MKLKSHRFCDAVCELFVTDPYWSVYDLDGAEEFFEEIGYIPEIEAVDTEMSSGLGL